MHIEHLVKSYSNAHAALLFCLPPELFTHYNILITNTVILMHMYFHC